MKEEESYVYSRPVLDFVTVSTEFCKQMEQCGGVDRARFTEVMRSLLPMLYLKMSLLGSVPEGEGYCDPQVSEADYEYVRANVARVMGNADTYLDVFVEDFKYSDKPVLRTVSEDLADIYQELRDLVEAFRGGYEEAMAAALYQTAEAFGNYWGQRLLGALRALHEAAFGDEEE